MQNVKLPLTIDALRAAQQNLDYVGAYSHDQVARIQQSVVSVDSDIETTLSFKLDSQRLAVIHGHSNAQVTLECQRCGRPFAFAVDVTYCFSPVRNPEQAEALPEDYEALDINELGEIDLLAAIEDEIILSLPIVPVHDLEHCEVSDADMTFGELPPEAEKPNPFAVLASLKRK